MAAYDDPKGKDPNFQLKQSGRLTDVQSSAVSGTRSNAFGKSIFSNQKNAQSFDRTPLSRITSSNSADSADSVDMTAFPEVFT